MSGQWWILPGAVLRLPFCFAALLQCAGDAGLRQQQQPAAAPPSGPASTPDDEFDYSAELDAAAAAAAAEDAATSDASPSPRSPMLPPPPPVDDSPGHIREYLATVSEALLESLPGGALPARIQPAQVSCCAST